MKQATLVCLCLLLTTQFSLLFASGVGTTGCQFLKLGVGARPIGMGEAYAGLADDVNAIYWNPAGLNQIDGKELAAMHAVWFESIYFSNIAYCQKGLNGIIGGAFNFLSAGKISKIDKDGNELNESYSPCDIAINLSYARLIKDIPAGATLKVISSKIEDESAIAFALDLGGMYKLMEGRLSLGLVLQNLGIGLKFIEERDPLPINIKAGSSYKLLDNKLTLVLDVNFPLDYSTNVHLGGEYTYEIGDIQLLLRIGYKTTTISDLDALSGLSVGFGTQFKSYGIDYGWVPYGDLGNTHRISLLSRF